jgi:hypothetical protein
MGRRERRFPRARPRGRVAGVFRGLAYLAIAGVVLGLSVIYTPHVVNGVAYAAGAGGMDTFIAQSNGADCSTKGGCHPFTTGVLEHSGTGVRWPGKVVPGSRFPVRVPFWPLGKGRTIISGTGDAITAILGGLILYLFTAALCGIPVWAGILTLVSGRHRREYADRYDRRSL